MFLVFFFFLKLHCNGMFAVLQEYSLTMFLFPASYLNTNSIHLKKEKRKKKKEEGMIESFCVLNNNYVK